MERDYDQVSRIWKPVSYWSILGKGMRLSREQRCVTTLITAAKETKNNVAIRQKKKNQYQCVMFLSKEQQTSKRLWRSDSDKRDAREILLVFAESAKRRLD